MGKSKFRLVIADDQFLTREGLKTILDMEDDMEVVGLAKNGLEAMEQVRQLRPDLVLMDIRMPLMDGIESIKRIKSERPDTLILILSTFIEEEYIVEGLANGASGYILKDLEGDKLTAAIRDAAAGQVVMQGVVAAKLASRLSRIQQDMDAFSVWKEKAKLTDREEDVSRLLMQGLNNREIAEVLQISDGTVRNYVSTLYSKLEVSNRAEAIVRLMQKLDI